MAMTPGQVNKMLKGFYNGEYTSKKPPETYYKNVNNRLKRTVNEAFGSKKGYSDLAKDLSINRQAFSGAKTYQMSRELQRAKRGAKSYDAYVKKALPIFEKYERWSQAEDNTAAANAQNAKKWQDIESESDLFPKLRYSAVMDSVTSEICRPLNGIVAPVDDPIWNKYSPCNHYNCRCLLEQVGREVRSTNKTRLSTIDDKLSLTVDPYFQVNVGKTKQLFGADHPYFANVPKSDRSFAKKNFGFSIN